MFKDISSLIEKSKSILILTHINPDGDALGSCVGFKGMVDSMGKSAVILLEKELSPQFSVFGDNFKVGECDSSFDLVVSLDCGDEGRLGDLVKHFKGTTISIDHHVSNTKFATVNYVDSKASATGEIIYELIKYMNVPFTKEMASALYGAILTDTGGFMFSNTTKKTHDIAGDLIAFGADYYSLNKKLIQEKDYKRHLIAAKCIENMSFFADGKICVSVFTNDYCNELDIKDDDLNGLAQVPRTISGVEAGVLITEINKGTVKVSLRSDEIVDVSKVAEKFGGGGHVRASGIRISDALIDKVKEDLIEEIKKQL